MNMSEQALTGVVVVVAAASAVPSLQRMFGGAPSSAAYVVVVDPEPRDLAARLAASTAMPIISGRDPAAGHVTIADAPADAVLASLAGRYGDLVIAVALADHPDLSAALEHVHACGGVVIAEETCRDVPPRLVDLCVAAERMSRRIAAILAPSEPIAAVDDLERIVDVVRARLDRPLVSVDASVVARRLLRRMRIANVATAEEYVERLREDRHELHRFADGLSPVGGREDLLGTIHETSRARHAPPTVLCDAWMEIVHRSPEAERFLVAAGTPTRNLLRLVHPGLQLELESAIVSARRGGGAALRASVLEMDGQERLVEVTVRLLGPDDVLPGGVLVGFDERAPELAGVALASSASLADLVAARLRDELLDLRDQLRGAVRRHESALAELRATRAELAALQAQARAAERGYQALQDVT